MPLDRPSRLARLAAVLLLALSAQTQAAAGRDGAGWTVASKKEATQRVIVKLRADVPVAEARALLNGAAGAVRVGSRSGHSWAPLFGRAGAEAGSGGRWPRRARRAPAGLQVESLSGTYVVELPASRRREEVLRRLRDDPRVEYAQPDNAYEVHYVPDSSFWPTSGSWGQPYDDLWALKKLGLEQAWDVTLGAGVVVAVVDSGIDVYHPDFFPRIWQNEDDPGVDGLDNDANGYIDDAMGWSFVTNDPDIWDRYGHGTHIAGIIAASPYNNRGLVGVAPEALLMPVKVVDDAGRSSSARLAAGIVYAADNGADIAVVASGCAARCPTDPVVEGAIRHATSVGMLVVVSAGNRGDDVAFYTPQNMVDAKPLVVAATTHLDTRASFSNFGDLVDLAAPGGGTNTPPPALEPVLNILSTRSSPCSPLVCPPGLVLLGGANQQAPYLRRAGTSMAAAHVAGVAALLLAADSDLSLDALRLRILGNVQDLGPAGHDPMFGAGRLTGQGALQDTAPFVLARIGAPASGQTVDGALRIVGAAAARSFARYEVSVGAGASPTAWETTGLTPVGAATAQGDLATWSTEAVADGPWTIRLVVLDTSGARREVRRNVTVDNSRLKRELVVDVVSESEGLGSVHVSSPRAYCDGAAGATQTCTYLIAQGASVTLTPLPDTLSTFGGWTGACTGTGPCTLTLSELRHVRATFLGPRRLVLVLGVVRQGQGIVVVSPGEEICNPAQTCSYRFKIGTRVTIRAFPHDPPALPGGTQFFWDPGQVCETNECTLLLNDHLTLRGTFVEEPEPIALSLCCSQTVERGTPAYLFAFVGSVDGRIVRSQWIEFIYLPDGNVERRVLAEAGEEPFMAELYLETPTAGMRDIVFAADDDLGQHAEQLVTVTIVEPGSAPPTAAGRTGGGR